MKLKTDRNTKNHQNGKGEKRRKSLSRSMQRLVLSVALLILIVASALNGRAMNAVFSRMFSINSRQIAVSMKVVTDNVGGFEDYAKEIVRTWEDIPEQVRKDPRSMEYRNYFEQYANGEYAKRLSTALENLQSGFHLGDMYLCAIDRQSGILINLLDPDAVYEYKPAPVGFWRQLTPEQTEELFAGDKDVGSYTDQKDELGRIQAFGIKIMTDEPPYTFLAMYEFPLLTTTISAVVFLVIYVLILSFLILLIVIFTRRRMKKRLVRPINAIASAAEQYVQQKKENKADITTCFSSLNIHTGDELEELGDVMAQMERDIGIYEQGMADAAAQQAHIKTELAVATNIQSHMLPDAKTTFTGRTEFSIAASMNPALEVGGDFYDFFQIDEDHLGIVIADVSGKGVPAALFMMSSMIIINNLATLGFSPREVLEKANEKILSSNVLDMFVTVWFGILDLTTGEVRAVNAGHEYPVICNGDSGFELMHDRHGLFVGGLEGTKYKEYSFALGKGDTLYLYTDGVPEATNAEGEMYGTDRLVHVLNETKDQSTEEICKAVKGDIDVFVKDAPQSDDITMVCIHYHGKHSEAPETEEQIP